MDDAVLMTASIRSEFTVMAESQEECWSRLCYAVEENIRLVAMAGEAEVGKSTLLQLLARQQRTRILPLWCSIDATGLTTAEFCWQLSQAVAAPADMSPWEGISDWLEGMAVTQGESVWIFDHLDDAADELTLSVRRLLRLMESKNATATVIAVARDARHLQSISDQVNLWCQLPAWDQSTTEKYLQQAETSADAQTTFSPEAIQAVQDCTGGIAGQISRLNELTRLAASMRDTPRIDVELVLEVWNELMASHLSPSNSQQRP